MPYEMTDKEFESVSELDVELRLQYFVKRVSDFEEMWGLGTPEGWVAFSTPSGQEALPFWPHPSYAQACAEGPWSGCVPERIELGAFLDRWIPGMSKDGKLAVVFPTASSIGSVMTPEILGKAIGRECGEKYGDDL